MFFKKTTVHSFDRFPKQHYETEACFMFINQGSFYVRAQNERLLFNKQTSLLAKCTNYFYETAYREEDLKESVEVVGIMLYPELIQDLFDFNLKDSNYIVDYNLVQVPVNQLLEYFRESVNILVNNPELADENLVRNKLKEFILLMTKTVKAPSELDFLSSMFKPNYVKFEEIIQQNLYSNLDLSEFATLCNMSLSTFKRKFKEVYAESPAKYITKVKMQKAVELLSVKELRVSDIAYELGYESLSTFNRVFKDQKGKTPTEYRLS